MIISGWSRGFGLKGVTLCLFIKYCSHLLLQAYRIGLYGSNHVWILSGPGLYKNWIMNSNLTGLGCTYEEIVKASDGHFTLDYELIQTQNEKIISGQVGPTTIFSL